MQKPKSAPAQSSNNELLSEWHQKLKPKLEEVHQTAQQIHASNEGKSDVSKQSQRLVEQIAKVKDEFVAKSTHIQEMDRYLIQQQQLNAGLQSDLKVARDGISSLQQELRANKEKLGVAEAALAAERAKFQETEQRLIAQRAKLEAECKEKTEKLSQELEALKSVQQTEKAGKLTIGLDFKKYEEIINYIQTWAKRLEEPAGILNSKERFPEVVNLSLFSGRELDDKPSREVFMGLDVDASIQHINQLCQETVDSVLHSTNRRARSAVRQLVANRQETLQRELTAHEHFLQALHEHSATPKVTMPPMKNFLALTKDFEKHTASLTDRIKALAAWLQQEPD